MKNETSPILKSTLAVFVVAMLVFAVSAALTRVHAQNDDEFRSEAALTTYAEFQYATITGSNNVLNVTELPVITPKGTVYKNLTLQVTVDSTGDVTVVPGSPTVVNAPTLLAAGFKAGKYAGPSTVNAGKNLITVAGPGVVAGGFTDWSATASSAATVCTYPASATWYVGSPTSASNPLYARLKKAGITSPAYSYGTAGNPSNSNCNPNDAWSGGTLIGVSQTGNQITIISYSTLGFSDSSTPKDQITYTLQ